MADGGAENGEARTEEEQEEEAAMMKQMMVVAEEMQEHEEEEYEAERAKVAAGLAWLAAKARSPESTCEDLRAPFYRDEYNQEHLKGNVGELLASGELYCHVFQQQLHGNCSPAVPRQGHWAVIQGLARRGLYVMEEEDCPVTEADLQNIPIRMSCHLAMLDSLMLACAVEQMSIEKVVTSVRRFSVVSPRELPFDLDGAMLLWINKVNMKLKDSVEKEQKQSVAEGACQQKSPAKWYWKLVPVRYRKDQSVSRQLPVIPVLRSLSEISDGRALLSLIHYYCPELLRLEDVCLKERLSPTERMYNIRLLMDVSQQHFEGCLLLTPSDLLRCPPALKTNIMAFVAELFWCFEVVRPEFVCPREPLEHSTDALPNSESGSLAMLDQAPLSPDVKQRPMSQSVSFEIKFDDRLRDDSKPMPKSRSKDSLAKRPSRGLGKASPDLMSGEDDGGRGEAYRDDLETSEMRISDCILRKFASGHDNLANGMLGAEGEQSEDDGKMKEHGSSVPLRRKASSQLPDKSVTFGPVTSADVRNMSPAEDGFDVQSLPVLRRVNSPAKVAAAHPQGKAGGGFYLHSTDTWSQPDANRASFVLNSHYDTPEKALAAGLPVVDPVNGKKSSIVEVDSDVDDSGKPQSSDNTDAKGAQSEFLSSPVPSPSPSPCPSVESNTSSSSGVKMTSFAERKFRKFNSAETKSSVSSSLRSTPDSSENGYPHTIATRQGRGHRDQALPKESEQDQQTGSPPNHPLASEVARLQMKLEEKRRAIEAQRRQVEALCAKQRQKFGKEAFMHVIKGSKKDRLDPQGIGGDSSESGGEQMLPARTQLEAPVDSGAEDDTVTDMSRQSREVVGAEAFGDDRASEEMMGAWAAEPRDYDESGRLGDGLPVEVTGALEEDLERENAGEADSGEYSRSIYKLNDTLRGLQSEMLRMAQQQEHLLQMRDSQQAMAEAEARLPQKNYDTYSLSPASSGSPANRTPTRRHLSKSPARVQLRSPRNNSTPRPNELRFSVVGPPQESPQPSLARVLSPQPYVDNLRHRRRYAPNEVRMQTSSTICFGDDETEVSSPTMSKAESDSDKVTVSSGKSTIDSRDVSPSKTALNLAPGRQDERDEAEEAADFELAPPQPRQPLPVVKTPSPKEVQSIVAMENQSSMEGSPVKLRGSRASSNTSSPAREVGTPAQRPVGLIEVDLSGMNTPEGLLSEDDAAENAADYSTDGEQKAALGFFFKGDQGPTEEERERRKAAFLQKQQKKAEEARLKKLQMEAEVEKKREEERRKAEEDEAKKAEKKADREYVREVFRRRHQDQQWEQHQARTKATKGAKAKIRKPRPKSAHREEGGSASLSPFKPAVGGALNRFHSASSLSLVSTTNSEPEGGRSRRPNRSGSMELLDADGAGSGESPTADKDWDNASQVSSHVSGGEYTGPKLYKEPSAKSNKHIIHNALSYCCLAGKVNELQKQKVIEELERCDANHYMILFRDAGCQYRALYAFFPETEEIQRVTGFGPKAVSAKMLDRLYKYSSDRKQFTSIPAKTISVSMDAFTIQNHLWQPRRPSSTIIPTTPTYSSSTATASKKPGPAKP
uniref:Calmodulin-regulated spectrin-associated protein 2 isoform X1 n=1 Tax=Petromyzon marinus TaxID=7757 RepID=A0AAJ7WYG8_PETMA|nr:calmodulin-regulated spectrin-associated protein 2 isoform X1 [Petromyzon marinus]